MLRCYKHIKHPDKPVRGSVLIPGGIKKLTGAGITGLNSCTGKREGTSHGGYCLRLVINNLEDNPLYMDIHDGYLDIFKNVKGDKRLMQLECELKPQTKIDYIITGSLQDQETVKLYLKFE